MIDVAGSWVAMLPLLCAPAIGPTGSIGSILSKRFAMQGAGDRPRA